MPTLSLPYKIPPQTPQRRRKQRGNPSPCSRNARESSAKAPNRSLCLGRHHAIAGVNAQTLDTANDILKGLGIQRRRLQPSLKVSATPTGAALGPSRCLREAYNWPKTGQNRVSEARPARLPVTSQHYRNPKKNPQFFPRVAGSRCSTMRMGNKVFRNGRSSREATGTKCASNSQPHPPPTFLKPMSGSNLGKAHLISYLDRPT